LLDDLILDVTSF